MKRQVVSAAMGAILAPRNSIVEPAQGGS